MQDDPKAVTETAIKGKALEETELKSLLCAMVWQAIEDLKDRNISIQIDARSFLVDPSRGQQLLESNQVILPWEEIRKKVISCF